MREMQALVFTNLAVSLFELLSSLCNFKFI